MIIVINTSNSNGKYNANSDNKRRIKTVITQTVIISTSNYDHNHNPNGNKNNNLIEMKINRKFNRMQSRHLRANLSVVIHNNKARMTKAQLRYKFAIVSG